MSTTRTRAGGERLPPSDRRVRDWLAGRLIEALQADRVLILQIHPLERRAGKENWAIDCEVDRDGELDRGRFVLRSLLPGATPNGHAAARELAVLAAVWDAEVAAPRPVLLHEGAIPLGRPFWIMTWLPGLHDPEAIVGDAPILPDRAALARRIAQELARLHSIVPPRSDLGFLEPARADPAGRILAELKGRLLALGAPRPPLAWTLDRLDAERPAPGEVTLCHRDLRTGCYRVTAHGFSGFFDWERAGWSDPHEDLGGFLSFSGRGGREDRMAGGLVDGDSFVDAYIAASGRAVDPDRIAWWSAAADMRAALDLIERAPPPGCDPPLLTEALDARRAVIIERDLLDRLEPGSARLVPPWRDPPPETTWERPGAAELLAQARRLLGGRFGTTDAAARPLIEAMAIAEREAAARHLPRSRLNTAMVGVYGGPEEPERFARDILAGAFRRDGPRREAALTAIRISVHDRLRILDPGRLA